MKKWFTICPFLLAASAVLTLYSNNVEELVLSDIVIPLLTALASVGLLLLLSRLVLRDMNKTLLILSIGVVLFFSFGHVMAHIPIRPRYLFIIWVIIFMTVTFLIIRTRKSLYRPLAVLLIIAIAFISVPTVNILAYEVGRVSRGGGWQEKSLGNQVQLTEPAIYRDIYYIILDRYGSNSVLREFTDYDNSEFTNWLSKRGFYVAYDSTSNYLKTRSSLASSLNMRYINYLSDEVGKECSDLSIIYEMLEDFEVQRLLKSVSYKYIHVGSYWEPTRQNRNADINIKWHSLPEFSQLVFESTMAYPVYSFLGDARRSHYESCLYNLERLAEISEMEEPTFVFAHFTVPHDPYVFDRDGSYLTEEEASKRTREVNYLNQLIFINDRIELLIDQLISNSETRPVIIVQADEGPFPERYSDDVAGFSWENATESELKIKTGILNAYYLPDTDVGYLYQSITPVNSFRLVFNLYFGTHLELLPDSVYAFVDEQHPYSFFDITDKVK